MTKPETPFDKYKSHKHKDKAKPADVSDLVARLDDWIADMQTWGGLVRDDILKLEEAVGHLEEGAGKQRTPSAAA
jgi:hypothetical protein